MSTGKATIDNELQIIILCDKMKWTYQEYMQNPKWFIKLLEMKNRLEAEKNNKDIKKYG